MSTTVSVNSNRSSADGSANNGDAAPSSAAVRARLNHLRFVGDLTPGDAKSQDCTLISTEHGAESASDHINLTLMVDSAGVVQDVRYRTPAQGDLLATYDVMAELCVGRALSEAVTITPRQVEAHLRQGSLEPALILSSDGDVPFYVLTKAGERGGIKPAVTPVANSALIAEGGGVTGPQLPWADIGLFEKVRRIEGVLDQHVRPALASDGGGIDLVDLKENELMVQYHGACGSCSSSIGGTLQFIQDSLNNHLATELVIKVSGAESADFLGL